MGSTYASHGVLSITPRGVRDGLRICTGGLADSTAGYFLPTLRVGFFALNLLLSACPLIAAPVQPLPLEALVEQAALILHGTVQSKTCLRDSAGRIYTRLEIFPDEIWKGRLPANPFFIVHGGGVLGEEVVTVADQANYAPGEEVVAFLRINSRREGVTISLSQGKFSVKKEPKTGEKVVSSAYLGVGTGPGPALVQKLGPDSGLPLAAHAPWKLEDFRRRIKSLLARSTRA